MTTWNNNHTQFARMLSEIRASGCLTTEVYAALQESMELGCDDIDEVFDRAQLEWERAKKGQPVRKTTPHGELEAFVDGSAV